MTVKEPDVMHWILNAPPMSNNESVNQNWITGDSRLLIVAGSDTTAAVLSFAMCELLRHPECVEKLREELDLIIINGFNQNSLQQATYLNSVINETLRLHPPVPSVLLRIAPVEGVKIGSEQIPGGTTINIPLFSLHRCMP
jgi:cytochrome P450